jgi:hypothetical protein
MVNLIDYSDIDKMMDIVPEDARAIPTGAL